MTLTKQSAVRAFALEISRQKGRPFKRVSKTFLDRIEETLRTSIAAQVHAAPGRKTLA